MQNGSLRTLIPVSGCVPVTPPAARALSAGERCAVHPGRPAVDRCPGCARARCRPDRARLGPSGCAGCLAPPGRRSGGQPDLAVRGVRAGLATMLVAVLGGFVATQYVDAHVLSLVGPGLVGLAAAWAASAAGGPGWLTSGIAAAGAVLGTALGFRLVPGGQSVVHPLAEVGPPYLCAILGVLGWPAIFGSPRRDRPTRRDRS